MLVLKRDLNESLILTTGSGEQIVIRVLDTNKRGTKLGIDAPADIKILRAELSKDS